MQQHITKKSVEIEDTTDNRNKENRDKKMDMRGRCYKRIKQADHQTPEKKKEEKSEYVINSQTPCAEPRINKTRNA